MDAIEALTRTPCLPRAPSAAPSSEGTRTAVPRDLVFVDLETSGCNASHHRIIEVGIVRVRDGVPIDAWSSLVNPGGPIAPATQAFTGISAEMLAGAPRFEALAAAIRERLGGDPAPLFVAHNARFDYAFLRAEFRRLGAAFSAPVLCTVKLSRRLFPEHVSHSLDALIERHALHCRARHRALGDAEVLADYWSRLLTDVPAVRLGTAVAEVMGVHRLPSHLPEGLEDELPEGPGAYRLYGAHDELLYVGRGRTLRARILAHFPSSADAPAPSHGLAEAVRRIEWEETAGELGAALREAAWIASGAPLRNRRLRGGAEVTVRLDDSSGVHIVAVHDLEPREITESFGLFQAANDAERALREIAAARGLCLKQLGLETSEGACVAHLLGRCKGVCIGREPAALHTVRVRMALAPLKLKAWPFKGRVAICERDSLGNGEWHVLEHWVYLGTARSEDELESLAAQASPGPFDAHRYRILVRYLAQHPSLEWRDLEADE